MNGNHNRIISGVVLVLGLFNMIRWVICVIGIAVDNLD